MTQKFRTAAVRLRTREWLVSLVLLTLLNGLTAEDIRCPDDASILNVKRAPYNAKGDGVADDTAAIQKAISDQIGARGFVYLPNGTYKVTDSLL